MLACFRCIWEKDSCGKADKRSEPRETGHQSWCLYTEGEREREGGGGGDLYAA